MRRHHRGFTLVELMIVVVLVGILSTIAVVCYRRWVASSHKAEATSVISGIATAEEAYTSERGAYVNVSGADTNLYPAKVPGPFKTEWGGPCVSCLVPWETLGFRPSAPVMFGYSVITSQAATSTSSTGGPIHTKKIQPGAPPPPSTPSVPATGPFYMITAVADTDGNGVFATALYHSDSKVLTMDSEGE